MRLHTSGSGHVAAGILLVGCAAAVTIVAYSAATPRAGERNPVAAATAVVGARTPASNRSLAKRDDSPGATEFAAILATATNHFSEATGERRRIEDVDCVKGAPADYMCSFQEVGPRGHACRLAHLRYTPEPGSTVTLKLVSKKAPAVSVARTVMAALPKPSGV